MPEKFKDLKPGDKFYLTPEQAEGTTFRPLRVWNKRTCKVWMGSNAWRWNVEQETEVGWFDEDQEVTPFRQSWQRWSDFQ